MAISNYRKELQSALPNNDEEDFVFSFIGEEGNKKSRAYAADKVSALAIAATDTEAWQFDLKPHDHQKDIIRATASHLSDADAPNTGYTVVPTGGGKTFVFSHIINALAKSFGSGATKHTVTPPTIILVPTEDLVDQTLEAFQDFPELEVGQYYGKQKQVRPVTVMVYNSFVDAVDKGWIKPGDISLLVMDEAHRGLSDLRQDIFDKFKSNTLMLAYTATPEFDENKNIDTLFGRDSHIYSTTTRQLINAKKLSPVDNYVLRVNLSFTPGAKPKNDKEMRQLMRIAKMKAAAEFMLDYEDPETGEMLLGDTTLGFLSPSPQNHDQSYVQYASRYFNETVRRRAEQDPFIASRVAPYTTIAEPMGSAINDSKEVLQRLRRGDTLAGFSVRYGREGSDIRRATNLFNIHGSTSRLDTRQAGGRVLRLWEGNPRKRAKIVDCFATVDGKRSELDNPVFYYDALGDESILKGVLDTDIHIDEHTKEEYLAEAKRLDEEEEAKPTKPRRQPVEHFLGEKELFRQVLGDGDARLKYNSPLRHVFDKMRKHYEKELNQPSPVPYIVAGEPLTVRAMPFAGGDAKVQFAVNESAVPAFRAAIRFPSSKTPAWLNKEECRVALFGTGKISEDYNAAYDAWWKAYTKHYETMKFRVEQGTHLRLLPPFRYNDHEIPTSECLDDLGNLQPVISVHTLSTLREMLGAPKAHGPSWCNKDQFMHVMLAGLPQAQIYRQDVEAFWQRLESYASTKPDEYKTRIFHINGREFPISFTLNHDGELRLGVARPSIPAIRKMLDVPALEWSARGNVDNAGKAFYNSGLSHKEQIASLRYDGQEIPEKTAEWLSIADAAERLGLSHSDRRLKEAFAALIAVHDATPNDVPVSMGNREIRCGMRKSARSQTFCIYAEDLDWISSKVEAIIASSAKTNEWMNSEDVTNEFTAIHKASGGKSLVLLAKRMMSYAKQKVEKHEVVTLDGQPLVTTFKRWENGHQMFCIDRTSFERLKNKLESFLEIKPGYITVGNDLKNKFLEENPESARVAALLGQSYNASNGAYEMSKRIDELEDQFLRALGDKTVFNNIHVTMSDGKFAIREDDFKSFVRFFRLKIAESIHINQDHFANLGIDDTMMKSVISDKLNIEICQTGRTVDRSGPIETLDTLAQSLESLGWQQEILDLRFEEITARLASKKFAQPKVFDRYKFEDGSILSTWENGKTRLVTSEGKEVEGVDEMIHAKFKEALKNAEEMQTQPHMHVGAIKWAERASGVSQRA